MGFKVPINWDYGSSWATDNAYKKGYYDSEFYDKAKKWIEEITGTSFEVLADMGFDLYQEFAYEDSLDSFKLNESDIEDVQVRAYYTRDINELKTSIEKCYRRHSDVYDAVRLLDNKDKYKERDKAIEMLYIMYALDKQIIDPEMLYVMQRKALEGELDLDARLQWVYNCWNKICEAYLSETEVYEQMVTVSSFNQNIDSRVR